MRASVPSCSCWRIAMRRAVETGMGGRQRASSSANWPSTPSSATTRRPTIGPTAVRRTLNSASWTAEIPPHGRVPSPAIPAQAGSPRRSPAGVELETTSPVSASQCCSATCLPTGDVEVTTKGN